MERYFLQHAKAVENLNTIGIDTKNNFTKGIFPPPLKTLSPPPIQVSCGGQKIRWWCWIRLDGNSSRDPEPFCLL